MGSWDKAILKSIGWGLFLITAYYFYEVGFPNHSASDYAALFIFFIGSYLVLSFGGWLLIGMPIHWYLCKTSKTGFIYYPLLALTLSIILLLITSFEAAIVLGGAAIFQASIFRHYVFKT